MKAFIDIHFHQINEISTSQEHILSEKELLKANSFSNAADRNRYINAHIFLRTVLSRYLNVAPKAIVFSFSNFHKPYLHNSNIYFNLSYRSNWALLGISNVQIGIDIEKNIKINMDDLAHTFFSKPEVTWLNTFKEEMVKTKVFFQLWTLKEAYIKATGKGISQPLNEFSVQIEDNNNIELMSDTADANEYRFQLLTAPDNYTAAIVYKHITAIHIAIKTGPIIH